MASKIGNEMLAAGIGEIIFWCPPAHDWKNYRAAHAGWIPPHFTHTEFVESLATIDYHLYLLGLKGCWLLATTEEIRPEVERLGLDDHPASYNQVFNSLADNGWELHVIGESDEEPANGFAPHELN